MTYRTIDRRGVEPGPMEPGEALRYAIACGLVSNCPCRPGAVVSRLNASTRGSLARLTDADAQDVRLP